MSENMQEKLKGILENLSDEQKERVKTCNNIDEILSVIGEEGVELPEEIVEAVTGGYIYKVYPDMWKVINDYCGSVVCTVYSSNRSRVESEALKAGQSKKEISHSGIRNLRRQL